MKTYDVNQRNYVDENGKVEKSKSVSFPFGKVLILFGIGLLVVALFGFGWPWFVDLVTAKNEDAYDMMSVNSIIVSAIGVLILSFVLSFKAYRKKTLSMTIFYFLDTIFWGILLSSIFLTIPLYTNGDVLEAQRIIGEAFGITAAAIILMGVLGLVWKNVHMIVPFLFALIFGVLIVSLINAFVPTSSETYTITYWVCDSVILVVFLLFVAIDINRIKKLVSNPEFVQESNIVVFGAYTLLSDFIVILIRILPYVLMSKSSKN